MPKLKYFFALSRTPHGILDLATPAVAALLWYGSIPPIRILLIGLATAFAGYTAVYALNDLMDYHPDQKKLELGGLGDGGGDLDALVVRHPLAQGVLTYKEALFWTTAWAFLALIGRLSAESSLPPYLPGRLRPGDGLLSPLEDQSLSVPW